MRDKDIEAYLCGGVRKLGGIAYKFVSPGIKPLTYKNL